MRPGGSTRCSVPPDLPGFPAAMIHYQLRCTLDHGFDGWFRDSAAFDEQAGHGLLECPVCGDHAVERALMAPAVARAPSPRPGARLPAEEPAANTPHPARDPAAARVSAPVPGPTVTAAGGLPAATRAALQRLRAEIERSCEYVGADFAEEARRIHNGESERRGIYGDASDEQAERLAEEGIEVARIPWVPRADG